MKDFYIINVQFVVQADSKHEAAKKAGDILNPLQGKEILDWGPKDWKDGNEMVHVEIDPAHYREGMFYNLL